MKLRDINTASLISAMNLTKEVIKNFAVLNLNNLFNDVNKSQEKRFDVYLGLSLILYKRFEELQKIKLNKNEILEYPKDIKSLNEIINNKNDKEVKIDLINNINNLSEYLSKNVRFNIMYNMCTQSAQNITPSVNR